MAKRRRKAVKKARKTLVHVKAHTVKKHTVKSYSVKAHTRHLKARKAK